MGRAFARTMRCVKPAHLDLGIEYRAYSEADDEAALIIPLRFRVLETSEYIDTTQRAFEAKITADHGEIPLNIRTTNRDGDLILYLTRADVPTLIALGTPHEWTLIERLPNGEARQHVAGKVTFDPAALLNLV